MPRPRYLKLPPERRDEILAVAARHFAESGFVGASLNRMLEEAGVSKGAGYYYFDDKGDLFATVVEAAWDRAERALWPDGFDPGPLVGPAFWPTLEDLYRRQVALFEVEPAVWRMAKATPSVLDDPSASRLAPRLDALMATVIRILRQAQQAGLVRDDLPIDLLLAMISGLDGAIDSWLLDHPDALARDPSLPVRTFAAMRRLLEPHVEPHV